MDCRDPHQIGNFKEKDCAYRTNIKLVNIKLVCQTKLVTGPGEEYSVFCELTLDERNKNSHGGFPWSSKTQSWARAQLYTGV